MSSSTIPSYTANLSAPYPLCEKSSHSFSISKSGHTFNFRMDVSSISSESLSASYASMGYYLRESASVFLLGNNQGEEQAVAHYCHRYGPSSDTSALYGYIVGQGEASAENCLDMSMFGNFANNIQTHFESNWDSSSLPGKSCIIA
ncbi:predicted protein [Naegleria gruberi]|uniref:Predicted protein n=1 Tax=Naegleria gruberi TaxID=5762 RepID=D2W3A0_NAEGR|nr:uncharacterized protein NAEGRDRAFT_75872 [Naegleria gruberi]EFC36480.1 predicted protein [Naegleria gruberi]|eukprot:XP_002669224.1 predicted protein [Naegleria gruberi strain NEG-M]